MTINEISIKFKTAKSIIKTGDSSRSNVVVENLKSILSYLKQLYQVSSTFDRAKCRAQIRSFDAILDVIETCGIKNNAVLAFFGIIRSSENYSHLLSTEFSEQKSQQLDSTDSSLLDSSFANASNMKTKSPSQSETKGHSTVVNGFNNEKITNKTANSEKKAIFTPDSLSDFIGQQHIVKELKKEIAIAKTNNLHHLDNVLLFGNPGLGKSTLMELVAKELGVNFEKIDCAQLGNTQKALKAIQRFLLRVAQEDKPVVIAFDEIHALSATLQESLLTLLNDRVYVSPPDPKTGKITRIPIKEFTFIGASTDDYSVISTLKNRCLRLTFQLHDYTHTELKQIFQNKVAAKGLSITDEALETCIPRARGAIRYVNSIVEGLDKALYSDDGKRISSHVDRETALKYFSQKGIDPIGLTDKDIEILQILNENPSEAIGIDCLSARAGLEPKKYLSEYERYLNKIGFLTITGKGRSLSAKGKNYLAFGSNSVDNLATDELSQLPKQTENPSNENSESIDIIDDIFN